MWAIHAVAHSASPTENLYSSGAIRAAGTRIHVHNRHCERSEAIHLAAQRKNGLLRPFAPAITRQLFEIRIRNCSAPSQRTRRALQQPRQMLLILRSSAASSLFTGLFGSLRFFSLGTSPARG